MSCLALDDPPTETGEAPRFVSSIDLVALPSAVTVTQLFIRSTLRRWRASLITYDAEAVVTELVKLSVRASNPAKDWLAWDALDYIVVRLVGYERSIVVEVWDTVTETAHLDDDQAAAYATVLELVDARAKDWGTDSTPRGRLAWAELGVYERTTSGLPVRTPKLVASPRPPAGTLEETAYDLDLLRRVRDGIERL